MKVKAHIRIAKNGQRSKVAATARPNTAPLTDGDGRPLPTVFFAMSIEVPDRLFRSAEEVIATLTLNDENSGIAATLDKI